MSKTERHLLRRKVHQQNSVIKTNAFDNIKNTVHFGILIHVLSWRQQKQSVCYDYRHFLMNFLT